MKDDDNFTQLFAYKEELPGGEFSSKTMSKIKRNQLFRLAILSSSTLLALVVFMLLLPAWSLPTNLFVGQVTSLYEATANLPYDTLLFGVIALLASFVAYQSTENS